MNTEALMKRALVLFLCSSLAAPGCATTRTSGVVMAHTPETKAADRAVLAEYVQRLPLGSPIRLDLTTGRSLRGTMLKATDQSLIIQPRTRVPEPAVEVSMHDVARVTLDAQNGTNLGKAIGIGAAAGAGAALGVFLIILAIFAD
jgi:hypothetical protein